MPKDPTKKPPATVLGESQELENQIRQRAYALYEARGREDGRDLEGLASRRGGDHGEEAPHRRLTIWQKTTKGPLLGLFTLGEAGNLSREFPARASTRCRAKIEIHQSS
jgi:hypothetical protein